MGFRYGRGNLNVGEGAKSTLFAKKRGIVQWVGQPKIGKYTRRTSPGSEVNIVPWEYVHKKCYHLNSQTLAPKVYEPWMGKPSVEEQELCKLKLWIANKRKEWLESDEGIAWKEKRKAKREKNEQYRRKTLILSARRWKERSEKEPGKHKFKLPRGITLADLEASKKSAKKETVASPAAKPPALEKPPAEEKPE